MGENEITRIVDRLDRMELARFDQMERFEARIEKTLASFRRDLVKLFGVLFLVFSSVFGYVAIDHFRVSEKVENNEDALSVVVGKMNQSDPGIMISKWNSYFNPARGVGKNK